MSEELTWAPAWRIRELIGAKEVSPVEVTDHFLGRIEQHEPVLQAFANVDPERVRHQAKAAEAAVLSGDDLGPLHGVPMAVKVHIDIEGLPRPGYVFWHGVARRDDPAVERLRTAGAVIVGHTVMPVSNSDGEFDWDAGRGTRGTPAACPASSSAGSAAAVAAGLLPVAVGSDGGGSSRLPAVFSGIVGVHPTGGLVPWMDHRAWAARIGTRRSARCRATCGTRRPCCRRSPDLTAATRRGSRSTFPIRGASSTRVPTGSGSGGRTTSGTPRRTRSRRAPRVIRRSACAAVRDQPHRRHGRGRPTEQWEDYLEALEDLRNRVHRHGERWGSRASAPCPTRRGTRPPSSAAARWVAVPDSCSASTTCCSAPPSTPSLPPSTEAQSRVRDRDVDRRRSPRHERLRRLHRDVQLAGVPGGVGAVRLRRRPARRPPDRRTARERPDDPPPRARVLPGVPETRTPARQLRRLRR